MVHPVHYRLGMRTLLLFIPVHNCQQHTENAWCHGGAGSRRWLPQQLYRPPTNYVHQQPVISYQMEHNLTWDHSIIDNTMPQNVRIINATIREREIKLGLLIGWYQLIRSYEWIGEAITALDTRNRCVINDLPHHNHYYMYQNGTVQSISISLTVYLISRLPNLLISSLLCIKQFVYQTIKFTRYWIT